jgi:hypothetical protein
MIIILLLLGNGSSGDAYMVVSGLPHRNGKCRTSQNILFLEQKGMDSEPDTQNIVILFH